MKLLLINPHEQNIISTRPVMALEKNSAFFPSLGLLYIATYLNSSRNHRAEVIDISAQNPEALFPKLLSFKPQVAGINVTSFNLLSALDVARTIKRINPNIKIILGGPHATIYPAETASYENVDFAVSGEGEKTTLHLLDSLESSGRADNIPGVTFTTDGGRIITTPPELIEDLDSLPFPDRTLLPYKKHFNILSERKPSTTMFSGRGCNHNCSFCYHSFGRAIRLRSASNVADEMEYVSRLGIRDVFFFDDSFTVSRKRVIELCIDLIRRSLNLEWAVRGRVDSVDSEMLRYMKAAGCRRIHYGVETANKETLRSYDKRITPEKVRHAFRLTRNSGIKIGADFMLGGPGETYSKIINTVNYCLELNPDFAFFDITTPYPKTRLYHQALAKGILDSDYWGDFAASPDREMRIKYWEEYLSRGELESLLRKAVFRFYFRPLYILKLLYFTRSFSSLFGKFKKSVTMVNYLFKNL